MQLTKKEAEPVPPKVKFTKDEIVQAALEVARKKGAAGVTTRDIAAVLGVSTRPVFTHFRSMQELRQAMQDAAKEICFGYLNEGLRAKIPFYGFGTQYIRFAREEPELYRMLFLGGDGAPEAMRETQKIAEASICRFYEMNAAAAERYFRDLWLPVHAMATLIVTGGCTYSDDEINVILSEISLAVCKAIKEIPGFAEGKYDRNEEFRKLIAERAV